MHFQIEIEVLRIGCSQKFNSFVLVHLVKHSNACLSGFGIEIFMLSVNFLRVAARPHPDFLSKNSVTSDLKCDRLLL